MCESSMNSITNSEPLVSIIIPVYNGSDYLDQAIESALKQSYSPLEILVINDGSNDDGKTREIALSFGSKIKYFEKDNGGVGSALNYGIKQMKGEFFSWLSHDDRYHPDKISEQINFFKTLNNLGIVYCDSSFINEFSRIFYSPPSKKIPANRFLFELVVNGPVNGCTMLIPKKVFDTVGVFREDLRTTQDYDLWFRIAQVYPFYHYQKTLVEYRIHEKQGSRTIPVQNDEVNNLHSDFIDVCIKKELFSKKKLDELLARISYIYKSRGIFRASKKAKMLSYDCALKKGFVSIIRVFMLNILYDVMHLINVNKLKLKFLTKKIFRQ